MNDFILLFVTSNYHQQFHLVVGKTEKASDFLVVAQAYESKTCVTLNQPSLNWGRNRAGSQGVHSSSFFLFLFSFFEKVSCYII